MLQSQIEPTYTILPIPGNDFQVALYIIDMNIQCSQEYIIMLFYLQVVVLVYPKAIFSKMDDFSKALNASKSYRTYIYHPTPT